MSSRLRSESRRIGIGLGELEAVELGAAGRAPQLAHDRQDPVLGHDPVDLGLGAGAVPHERVAVAHELAQLSDSVAGRSSPRRVARGAAWRPGPWRRARRSSPGGSPSCCRARGPGARGRRALGADRPPSTSRRWTRGPPRARPGGSHGLGEFEWLADEAFGAEHLPVFGHPVDGRLRRCKSIPTYCRPLGPPPLFEVFFWKPEHALGSHEGRRPRPFIASGWWRPASDTVLRCRNMILIEL